MLKDWYKTIGEVAQWSEQVSKTQRDEMCFILFPGM